MLLQGVGICSQADGHVPIGELREARVAGVCLRLDEVRKEAKLIDECVDHLAAVGSFPVRVAETREATSAVPR